MLLVMEPCPLTTVQDRGRPGLGHVGISPSGALDGPSAALANRLVGNQVGAAVLEATMQGPVLRILDRPAVLAVTGAPAPVRVDGRPVDMNQALHLPAGSVLSVGAATAGVRTYLAVRGGVAIEPVLGSRSHDLLSGLGPPPLAAGDELPVGSETRPLTVVDFVPVDSIGPEALLYATPGPRDDWFIPPALGRLGDTVWVVSLASNRVGLRLSGPALTRRHSEPLPPEGLVTGSIQIPPDGQPVLFLADHPSTGGYPVIAVIDDASLAAAAQARPGSTVRIVLRRRP